MRVTKRLLSPFAVGLVTACLTLSACGSDGTGDRTGGPSLSRSDVVAQITDDVILPGLGESATATSALEKSVSDLCANPDDAALGSARDAWRKAHLAWMKTSAYQIGPIGELHSKAKVAYPVNNQKLEALLAGGGPDLSGIDDLGAHLRGLGGIEYVLFTPADAAALEPSRCNYARAAAASVAAGAAELADAWNDGYAKEFKASGQDAIDQLVNASLSSLATVDDMILGEKSVDDAGPADTRLADGAAELASVAAVWGESPDRLAGLVSSKSKSAARSFGSPLQAAVAAVDALSSLEASDAKAAAGEHVSQARVALRTSVSSQLGVTIAFTDSDGDG